MRHLPINLLLSTSTDDAVDAVERSGSNKQDVGGVNCDGVTASSASAAVWNVHNGPFEQLQHALDTTTFTTLLH